MTNTWNAQHYAHHSLLQEDFAHKALSTIVIQPQDTILDIGCGDGKITAYMAQKAHLGKTIGIDACANMINHAHKRYAHLEYISFKHLPAESISADQKFDIITCFNCFHWIKDQQKTLNLIAHALKSNGKFILLAFADKQEPLLQALYQVLTKEPWSLYTTTPTSSMLVISDKNQLEHMVSKANLSIINNDSITIGPYNTTKDLFKQWLAGWLFSLPQIQPLSQEQKDLFLASVTDTYLTLRALPVSSQELSLTASELLLIAQKTK